MPFKANFLNDPDPDFTLFETLGWTPDDGYYLLERHLARLADSAIYFGFKYSLDQALNTLHKAAVHFRDATRVRLDLFEDGHFKISAQAMPSACPSQWIVCLADTPVNSQNRFLFHKTSNRQFYDSTRAQMACQHNCQEVLFYNENGFLTEGSFTNIFLKFGKTLFTPALSHGLLPGVLRSGLLEHGYAQEADLRLKDLRQADAVYVGNSLRGLIPATVK